LAISAAEIILSDAADDAAVAGGHGRAGLGNGSCILSSGKERDDYNFTEVGKRETGFVILATRTDKSVFRDETGNSRVHESVHHEEVTEFSEAPLEPHLFVPPQDFKRVPQLPDGVGYALTYRMRLRWEILKDSFSLPNRIAKFTT
jgi:hypothetical protein